MCLVEYVGSTSLRTSALQKASPAMNDFLDWKSDISLHDVFGGEENIAYPGYLHEGIVHLASLPDEGNRSVLLYRHHTDTHCLTPAGYSVGTSINEYGGKPFWVIDGSIIFANRSDQCLYRQDLSDDQSCIEPEPVRLTVKPSSGEVFSYSSVISLSSNKYVAIVECHRPGVHASLNTCFIALIDGLKPNDPPVPLVEGADFYSDLVYDADNNRLAWIQWNHPNMPWDENRLGMAEFGAEQQLSSTRFIQVDVGNTGKSHGQLCFAADGKLFFCLDFSNASKSLDFWNMFAWCPDEDRVHAVTQELLEFGYPHWQYGDSRIAQLDGEHLVTIGSSPEGDHLFRVNTETLTYENIYYGSSTLQGLCSDNEGRLLFVERTKHTRPALCELPITSGAPKKSFYVHPKPVQSTVSLATHISYPTRDGRGSHGFYYSPESHCGTKVGSTVKPPLLVMVHGGPTARAYGHFDIQKQFWTSHGFAVLDVNHHGSTGYGRAYRDALYGNWGELDVSDIIDGIAWLVDQGLVDPTRVCIRGKSAGGYAVLRALTEYPDVFRAGACYYGIGNLATLAKITHKFEKHYTDRLIDEVFDEVQSRQEESQFYSRSPIHKISRIRSAMIIFQGGQDNVVPPSVAHEIIDQLESNGVNYEYTEYPEEGHGFKQVENNMDAWSKELNFYRQNMN